MATMNSGLGGAAGYGENVFSTATKASGGNDDGSVAIDISSVFGSGIDFYGTNYSTVYLNSNGSVSFGSPFTSPSSSNLASETTPMLAPFLADVDITSGGEIYWDLDPTAGTVTMTWLDVAPYSGTGTNSFQMVLTDAGGGDFSVEYIYEDIQWAGSGSDAADVGWTDGGANDVLLDGSANNTELQSYDSNDFGTGDPVGTTSQVFTNGVPSTGDGTVTGSTGNDVIDGTFTDGDGDTVTSGNDTIEAAGGDDTIYGGGGDDSIDGGDGADVIVGDQTLANDGMDTISGGIGNDVIYGDSVAGTDNAPTFVSWANQGLADETSVAGGTTATSDDGNININVTVQAEANFYGASVETGDPLYNYNGASDSSSLAIEGGDIPTGGTVGNDTNAAVVTLDFSAAEAGYSDEVSNVTFGIFDIDELQNQFIDQVTVTAYDANNVAIPVTVILGSTTTLTSTTNVDGSQTVESILNSGGAGSTNSQTGYAQFSVAGPVSYIEIDYNNTDPAYGGHAIRIGDVQVTPIPEEPDDGNADTLSGDAGDDLIYGQGGDDVIYGGSGFDTAYGGAGNDSLFGFGDDDTLFGGDGNDYVDGDDGNDSLSGGSGADTIVGDAGTDSLSGGDGDDALYGGDDNDTLTGDSGNDTAFGGQGSDTFLVSDDHETTTIIGGEDLGDTDIDAVDFGTSETSQGVTVTSTGDEAGTFAYNAPSTSSGITSSGSYVEIEELNGTFYDDTFNMGSDNSGVSLDANEGDDVITTGSGDDVIEAGSGADTINAGAGDDVIGLAANTTPDGDQDVIILQDGFGSDTVLAFDAPTPGVGNTFVGVDTFDVTNLTDGTDPVNVNDVTVTDTNGDGTGDAILTFPNGESVTLVGIDPATADNPFWLNAVGIPLSDGTVEGTSGADTIGASYTGDPDGDMVDASDAILAGDTGDDDLIYAYGGNDSIYSGGGVDEVYGGSGDDTIINGSGDSTLHGDAGNDTVYGSSDSDTIYGGANDDTIYGNIGADETYGGDGNDTLTAGGFAGTGDTMSGDAGNDTLSGGAGNDTILGGTGDDNIIVAAGGGTDAVEGGEDLGDGDIDTLTFSDSSGPDGVDINMSGDEAGTYSFPAQSGTGTFTEIEQFTLTEQNDVFDGVLATSGNTVDGGAGDDVLTGSSGDDSFVGGTGNDTLTGGDGADTLTGGADQDVIYGGVGDVIDGSETGVDNDTLIVSGVDFIDYDTNPENGIVYFEGGGSLTFTNIENVVVSDRDGTVSGTAGDDLIDASYVGDPDGDRVDDTDAILVGHEPNDDLIEAGAGNDTIIAGAGDDTVYGEAGDDTITGGTGDDVLQGGADQDIFLVQDGFGDDTIIGGQTGNNYDTLDLSGLSNPVTVVFSGPGGGTITDQVTGDVITFSEIEQLILTNQADVVDANGDDGYTYIQTLDGNDSYVGSAGDDVVDEEIGAPNGQGNDTFYGGAGNDEIWAGTDNDTVFGGTGADTLNGQDGNDTITFSEGDTADGGQGDDLFVLEDLGETSNGAVTIDGGAGNETGGDTLQLGSLANLTQAVRDTFVDDGTGSYSGTVTLDDGTILNFSEIENIICFTPGTRIATPRGLVAIEDFKVGDLVVTRDHGLQPIRWIETRTVPAVGRFAPVRIRPNVLAGQDRDLLVSPQHRVLFQGYRAELLFGESEVLVAAKHLVDGLDVTQDDGDTVTYIHMMFDQHEIIYAEGAATESFHPGDIGFSAVGDAAREELFAIFPELRADPKHYGNTARRCLKSREAKLIRP